MPDDSERREAGPPVPAPPAPSPLALDRPALERVLARAAQLQAGERDPGEPALSEAQLVEVGKEVGLSERHLRQALAEERTRVVIPEEQGAAARMFGSAAALAVRTVPGSPEAIFRTLDGWMQREESLTVKRRFPDRMVWEPRPGVIADIRRGLNLGGRGYHLSRAHEVSATVIPVDGSRSVLRLEADLSNVRTHRVIGGGVMAGGGLAAGGIVLVLGLFAPIAAIPVAAGLLGGYGISRSHAPLVSRAQLSLEQVLDMLERGELARPPSFISTLARPTF